MNQGLHIGKVAKETGLGIHTIRFYERLGLLRQPLRSESGYRLFDQSSVSDLNFVRKAQGLGFTLEEIRELLVLQRSGSQGCSHVRDLLSQKIEAVKQKIAELLKLQSELRLSLRKCNRDLKRRRTEGEKACPVLRELRRTDENQEI